jgi:drug/metabolite transporter (DMT)-like permease
MHQRRKGILSWPRWVQAVVLMAGALLVIIGVTLGDTSIRRGHPLPLGALMILAGSISLLRPYQAD